MQVELIRFRKKYRLYSRLLLQSEEFSAMFTQRDRWTWLIIKVFEVETLPPVGTEIICLGGYG